MKVEIWHNEWEQWIWGDLIPVDRERHFRQFEGWRSQMWRLGTAAQDWRLPDKVNRHLEKEFFPWECFCLEAQGALQGYLFTSVQGERTIGSEERMLYIRFVTSAPWNQRPVGRFSKVGTRLIEWAARLSWHYGFEGRVGLHALPGSEPFYRHLGMEEYGPDDREHNLIYFEQNFPKMTLS